MLGAEVQQPGLTREVPEPSVDAQEIPLQSPRDLKEWASQVMPQASQASLYRNAQLRVVYFFVFLMSVCAKLKR